MSGLLPQHAGLLPYFLLYDSAAAIIHTAVCYLSPPSASLAQFRGRCAPPPHGLLARVYGVKNVYTALVRAYAAYHITDPNLYTLALCTLVGVLWLYATELFVYKTARPVETVIPFVTAGSGAVWMLLQREFYVGV